MTGVRTVTVSDGEAGQRLDRWFKRRFPDLRHGELEKLLRKGQIRVNGGRVKANRRVEAGEEIRVPPLAPAEASASAPARKRPAVSDEDAAFIRSRVIYEDDAIIAIDKPFGLAVQGGTKTARHIDGMLDALVDASGERPRLVHRLDRDTAGVLVLARDRKTAAALSKAFQTRQVEKTYWGLVVGAPKPFRGHIDLAVAKQAVDGSPDARELMVAAEGGDAKKAYTSYVTIDKAHNAAAWLALRPHSGRTHQLRVHCAAIGHPIVGDVKYGGEGARIDGIAGKLHLFAREIAFRHPKTGRPLHLVAPLSGHMKDTWAFFGFNEGDAKDPFAELEA